MLLCDFLETRGYTQQAFADLVGCSRPTVSYWARGIKKPRPYWIQKIRAATQGRVTANDLQAAVELAA
jgi:DNA-binding transcriptional regulator YdaS (Cro superfamily)